MSVAAAGIVEVRGPWGVLGRPWVLAGIVAAVAVLMLFPVPVLLGTAAFWDNPRGIAGGSARDMLTAQSGYLAFVRDGWRWPLLQTEGLGPSGVNVAFTDSVPVVVLVGRLLFQATGRVVPLYGVWSGLCVGGMALAFVGLVRALGARGPVAAVVAAIVGVSMPAFLARWGHLSLMAQGLVPWALIVYLRLRAVGRLSFGGALGACLAVWVSSLLVHPYLFMMVAGIVAAGVLQAGTDRRLPWGQVGGVLLVLAGVAGGMAAALGYGGSGAAASGAGFGVYSANLVSLFVPYSGVLLGGATFVMDGTGGQYEGMAFVGTGVVILAILGWASLRATVAGAGRRHPWLLAVVAGCVVVAVSNEVYLGRLHVLSVALPGPLQWVAGVVRASGRFMWVPMYLLAALAVAAAARRRGVTVLLVLAAGVQWVRAEPIRQEILAGFAGRPASMLDYAAWRGVLGGVDQVAVDPPFACLEDGDWLQRRMTVAVELQSLAVRAGVPTNTIYAARVARDCRVPALTGRSILVRLGDGGGVAGMNCVVRPIGSVCSAALGVAELQGLLPEGEAPLPE